MADDPNELAYIIRRHGCGCVCFVSTPRGMTSKETAKDVAQMLREGYSIERVTYEVARAAFGGNCDKCRKPSPTATAPLFEDALK